MYPKGTAKSTSKLVMAWAFKIITLIWGIWLSIIVAQLSYQSFIFMLHHAVHFQLFEHQALINGTVLFTLMPAIWIGTLASILSFTGKVNIVFSRWLNDQKVNPNLPSTPLTAMAIIRASARSLAIKKTTFINDEAVFFNSIISGAMITTYPKNAVINSCKSYSRAPSKINSFWKWRMNRFIILCSLCHRSSKTIIMSSRCHYYSL